MKKISGSSLGGFVGSMIFNLNSYFIVTASDHVLIAVAIAFVPLLLYFYIGLMEEPSLWRVLACSATMAAIGAYDFRIFYILFLSLLLGYFFSLRAGRKKRGFLSYTAFFLFPLVVSILLNAYWLVPYYMGGLGGSLQGVVVGRPIFTGGTLGTNLLHNSFTIFDPMWSGGELTHFSVHPIPFYWFIVPLLAFSTLLFEKLRRNGYILVFSAVALVGIFLSKFYFPPFSGSYGWLYNNFPGFNAFREPSKFTFLIYLPFAVLLGCLIGYLQRYVDSKCWKLIAFPFLMVLIVLPFLINAVPVATGSAGSLFINRSMPNDYEVFKDFILEQPGFFRTLWVPVASPWSFYDDDHPRVSCIAAISDDWKDLQDRDRSDLLQPENITNILERPFSRQLLKSASIKYVIVPLQPAEKRDDFFTFYGGDRHFFIDKLDALDYLERIDIGTSDLAVYYNQEHNPPALSTNNICKLDPEGDLDSQYDITRSIREGDVPFTLDEFPAANMAVNDLLAPDELDSVVAEERQVEVPATAQGENLSIYADRGRGELRCSLVRGMVILRRLESGLLTQNGRTILEPKTNGEILWTKQVSPNGEYWLEANGAWIHMEQGKEVNLGETSNISCLRLYREGANNLIPNGSFEEGLWREEAIDCSESDDNPELGIRLNNEEATDGRYSLQLEGTRHKAGTYAIFPVESGQEYYFSFQYQSPNSKDAGYCFEFNDEDGTKIGEQLAISGSLWHYFQKAFAAPQGATSAKLYVYSYEIDGQTTMINRYDNFELRQHYKLDEVEIARLYNRFTRLELEPQDGNSQFMFISGDSSRNNIISNSSFEERLWGEEVVDCSEFDEYPDIGMRINDQTATDGSNSLQLEAARHIAGTYTVFPVEGNQEYHFSFDYQSPNATDASYYILFNDNNRTVFREVLPISGTEWQHFQRRLTTPIGATVGILYVYSNPSNGNTRMINRYDNFELIKALKGPGLFYLVKTIDIDAKEPAVLDASIYNPSRISIKVGMDASPFVLVLNQKYDPGWWLVAEGGETSDGMNGTFSPLGKTIGLNGLNSDNHFRVDGNMNAWYVDPEQSYSDDLGQANNELNHVELTFSLEFFPQRKARLGSLLSLITLFGCLAIILVEILRSLMTLKKK